MYIIKDKYTFKEKVLIDNGELYNWWAFSGQNEITWSELTKRLSTGEVVHLASSSIRLTNISVNTKKEKICLHPKKYKNVVSRSLIFWVCPDCKKDLGNG